jgi:hypothetical protein
MTEEEWLTPRYASGVPKFLRTPEQTRRIRLYACAACRRVWHLLPERCRKALVIAEQHADGAASDEELDTAKNEAFRDNLDVILTDKAKSQATRAVENACAPDGGESVSILYSRTDRVVANLLGEERKRKAAETGDDSEQLTTPSWFDGKGNPRSDVPPGLDSREACHEAALLDRYLRDIFGNPYRPVTFSPSWRTDTAVALARTVYEARDFSAMPILADALQDAGCDSADILDHCRGPGPHVRGCWVVDLVLGKE